MHPENILNKGVISKGRAVLEVQQMVVKHQVPLHDQLGPAPIEEVAANLEASQDVPLDNDYMTFGVQLDQQVD